MLTKLYLPVYLPPPPPSLPCPAISVIIPLYNTEKYIGECLESILNQTFQSFEVIVVDDCSTDNSVKVVESYIPKFNGRLRLYHTEKNSGRGGYVPRNIGLNFAGGKYVYFVDADDFILLTALEILYNAAEEYDADVVYMTSHYWMNGPQKIIVKPDQISGQFLAEGTEEETTLIVDASNKLVRDILLKNHHRTPWTKLILRKLLTENNILFPEITIGEDNLWTLSVYAHSKRFLRLPLSLYFLRRYTSDTLIKSNRPDNKYDPLSVLGFIKWFKALKELTRRIEFLKENPDLSCQMAKGYFDWFGRRLDESEKTLYVRDVCDILRREFFDDFTANFLKLLNPEENSTRAVSVIISLYNYGKYVGECLDSLLAQTFTDFEVIVADDCSTDNGFEIVKSYAEKFGGRLKFIKTETNSGGGGEPRNLGFSLAQGEYVFFMDADDVMIPTGLEEMYTLAKEYYADVVYCEKYFMSTGIGQEFKDNVHFADMKCQKPPFVDKPTFDPTSMTERILKDAEKRYWGTAWLRFVRRDLLIENDIKFLSLIGSNDVGWSYQVLFCSRRFLRVPNACYIRRVHEESVSFRKREVPEHVHKWMDRTIRSLKYMDDFMNRFEFFRENPKYRHMVLKRFVDSDFGSIQKECEALEPFEVADIFRKKFGDYLGKHDVLVSCLCAKVVSLMNQNAQINNNVVYESKYRNYLTARVDIGFTSQTEFGDFQILYISDKEATVKKAKGFQKGNAGYQIQSYVGDLKFVVEATINGRVRLSLRGVDVRDPKDNSKRIPYWIDYTKLTVNGETIFDKLTPLWHDEPFIYKMNVKTGEEITIEVEWLPHRSDN